MKLFCISIVVANILQVRSQLLGAGQGLHLSKVSSKFVIQKIPVQELEAVEHFLIVPRKLTGKFVLVKFHVVMSMDTVE